DLEGRAALVRRAGVSGRAAVQGDVERGGSDEREPAATHVVGDPHGDRHELGVVAAATAAAAAADAAARLVAFVVRFLFGLGTTNADGEHGDGRPSSGPSHVESHVASLREWLFPACFTHDACFGIFAEN